MDKVIKLKGQQQKWLKKHKHKLGVKEIANYLDLSEGEARRVLGLDEAPLVSRGYEKSALIGLLVVAFLVLATSLPNQFVSDDISAILANPLITSWSKVTASWWGSLQNLIYFVLTNIFGVVPWPLRLTNIIFHLSTTGLLFFTVRRTQSFWVSIAAAALFVTAPTILEPVIWISGMPYVLAGLMTMLCVYLHLDDNRTRPKDWLESVAWLAALTTNEKFIFVPILLLVWDWHQRRVSRTWQVLLALITLSLVKGVSLLSMLGSRVDVLQSEFYNLPVSQVDNPVSKVLVALGYYIQLYFWPSGLTLYHSEIDLGWLSVLRYGSTATLLGLTVWLTDRKNDGWWFWGALGLVSLVPVLLPLGVSSLVAERYAYLAYASLAVVLAKLIFDLSQSMVSDRTIKIFLGLAVLAMMGRSLVRIQDWKTADRLWFSAEKSSPHSWQNHNNLGDAYSHRGDYERAIAEFTTAIELNSRYADAIHNRANTYLTLGNKQAAKEGFLKAVEINPKLWQSRLKLAEIEESEGNLLAAIDQLKQVMETQPTLEVSHWLKTLEKKTGSII